jgi:hypothetical protein
LCEGKHNRHQSYCPLRLLLEIEPDENTVSKAPNATADQFQNLEDLYQGLLTLRSQVRQAERLHAERLFVEANARPRRHVARGKSNRRKRSK